MKKIILLLFALITTMNMTHAQGKESVVQIETDFGTIKFKLYNETPQHRDNFLKLVKERFYTDLLFHRVIENFMIQGGDPNSELAQDTTKQEAGDLDYKIPAEIQFPRFFHKKGTVSAARTSNNVNPERESSASQFFIVSGRKYSDKDLTNLEKPKFERAKQDIYNRLQSDNKETIKGFYSSGDLDGLAAFRQGLYAQAEQEAAKTTIIYTVEQRDLYKELGGAPHLDGEYTVFGEVVEGLDVVDKIQKVKTDKTTDRPKEKVRMSITLLEE